MTLSTTLLLSVTFLLLFSVTVQNTTAADPRDRFQAAEYTSPTSGSLKYRMLSPHTYSAERPTKAKYPLVIFLHGAGERGDNNRAQLIHGMGDFASDAIMEKYPAFVIAPQCPKDEKWVNVDWGSETHSMPKEPSDSMRLTLELVESLLKELPIDKSRIYITGLSMGGYGTWDALQRRPELFAGAVPICGGGDTEGAEVMKDIPVWAFHGDQDGAVKVRRSRDMIAALKAAGGNPKYTEYPGVGHNSWSATYANPEMYAWLFAQKKPAGD